MAWHNHNCTLPSADTLLLPAHVAGILHPFLFLWRSVMLRMMGWEMTVMASSLVSTMNCTGVGGVGSWQGGDGCEGCRAGAHVQTKRGGHCPPHLRRVAIAVTARGLGGGAHAAQLGVAGGGAACRRGSNAGSWSGQETSGPAGRPGDCLQLFGLGRACQRLSRIGSLLAGWFAIHSPIGPPLTVVRFSSHSSAAQQQRCCGKRRQRGAPHVCSRQAQRGYTCI